MKTTAKKTDTHPGQVVEVTGTSENRGLIKPFQNDAAQPVEEANAFEVFSGQMQLPAFNDLFSRFMLRTGKSSFLVFKHHKYFIVPIEKIAFFHVKYESSFIVCFDGQEYSINYSLEHLQKVLTVQQFFRLNRQYLINFGAVKEVEHYFARKLLVKLNIATQEKLLVAKEKVSTFLNWLDNR